MITRYVAKQKITLFAVFGMIAAMLMVGCGTSPDTTTASTAPVTPTSSTTTATATLKHVPTGTADLSWDPTSHMLTVKISLTGLAPSSTHPSHIHTGSCGNQGNVLYPLSNLMADAHGVATATTTVNVPNGIPAKGWYINVHNGPTLTPADQFLPIVCGDVTNANVSMTAPQATQVMLTKAPFASTGESVSGTAQLTLSGGTLTVKLTMNGLEPNSTHAAHIHSGSCESQGAVVYPLTTITADGTGKASVTTTINNVKSIPSSGWYINVHHSAALTTQTGFDPVTCGNVVTA